MGTFGDFGNLGFVATWGLARFCESNFTALMHPQASRIHLIYRILLSESLLHIGFHILLKPDRVVRSRGRSGMGSNIAWHRRHNDSVD